VLVTLSAWRGQHMVHVREYTPGALSDQWWPAKGACLDVSKLSELIAALHEAEAEARCLGLIDDTET
jgi:Transcriptional Coactivator p15 (PC4)